MSEITVKVTFWGNLPLLFGRTEEEIKISEPTLKGLIEEMGEKWNSKISEQLIKPDKESLTQNIIVLVEGSNLEISQDLLAPLKEGSHIIIAPVIGGG